MSRLKAAVLLSLLCFAPGAQADITLTDSNMESMAVSGNVITGGTCSLTHVSHLGDLTTTASDAVTLTNYVIVGTPTLDETATCNQVAVYGTPAGDSECSEAWLALTISPFRGTADLRLHKKNGVALVDTGATVTGHTADARGRGMKGDAWDIGAYESWTVLYPPLADYGFSEMKDPLEVYRP